MKNLTTTTISFILLTLTQAAFAQVSDSELIGTWKVDVNYIESIFQEAMDKELEMVSDPEEKKAAQEQMALFIPKMLESFAGIRMTFNADGTYENYSPGFMGDEPEEKTGTWYLEGSMLYTTEQLENGEGEEKQVYITHIDANSMVIEPQEERGNSPIQNLRMLRD